MSGPGGRHREQALPRSRRITRGSEIRAIFQRGKRSRTAHLDVFYSDSPVAHPRVGVVVPRHRHNVVERNRVKRRLREILRREVLPRLGDLERPLDMLVRARKEAYGVPYRQLRDELVTWANQLCSRASSSS